MRTRDIGETVLLAIIRDFTVVFRVAFENRGEHRKSARLTYGLDKNPPRGNVLFAETGALLPVEIPRAAKKWKKKR